MKLKISFLAASLTTCSLSFAQSWNLGGNNDPGLIVPANQTLGTDALANFPLRISTGGVQRMHINQNGTFDFGAPTGGFIGIGTQNPGAPLHIIGSGVANSQGWTRGLTLSNNTSMYFDAGIGASSFFFAHPSFNPADNFYAGSAPDLTPGAQVDYAFSVYTNTPMGAGNPLRSTQFFKNLLVSQDVAANVTPANERRVGFNTLNPQNILEINTSDPNPNNGRSGIRLTDLTTASPVTANPGAGVLGVDQNGDVIYVEAQGAGNYCGGPLNPLTGNYQVPLNGNNYHFTGLGLSSNQNNVAIGTVTCLPSFNSKLTVQQNALLPVTANTNGINTTNTTRTNTMGLFLTGVKGTSNGPANGMHIIPKTTQIGGEFSATNGFNNVGVRGIAVNTFANNSSISNIGGVFYSHDQTGDIPSIGIYSTATGGSVNYAAFFDGDAFINGGTVGTGFAAIVSDAALKRSISSIHNATNIIGQLDAKTFYFDTTATPFNFSSKLQFGFIAQDVETVLPMLVKEVVYPDRYDTLGNFTPGVTFKSLNYQAFIPLLTKAFQEQKQELDSLRAYADALILSQDALNQAMQAQLAAMQAQINQMAQCVNNLPPGLCGGSGGPGNGQGNGNGGNNPPGQHINEISVELADMERVVLDQNVPNPFAEQTVITYYLPETTGKAQMLFYDNNGRLINSVDLKGAGHGKIQIFAGDLSRGTYTYALVVDGQIVDSKRMVKMD